ncbi:TIGR02266 family protein [Archangium lansingense]|uniref:TIGR02266 family protein n=1 Tax=Archangium lansingense TaxID=2995310 RepID=A0ABT4AS63_9BACT|nr:TIGR02266 family protein [Archangium lansinium]MCY1083694.1 TIGR02266 family protein [Archangium lansinium]
MNAPSTAAAPTPSRETELARAESELASQEARLGEQLSRAAAEAETHSHRLMELRQQVERGLAERPADEHVRGAGARLESASVHTGSTEDARERALSARHEALEARRRGLEEAQRALQSLQHLNTRAQQDLAEAEAGLKRSTEAAARAQREREAAARQREREATQAKAARPVERAQAKGNTTQVDPNPQGARTRVRMVAAIDQGSDSNFFTGFTTNINEGGIFVATVQSVPRGTTVDVDVLLPGTRAMQVTGVVRWTREVNDKTPELMPGLGVKFTYLPPEVTSVISDFVVSREPMFFPD